FRFLDLPGELRNRIYEYAAASTYRYFPTATFHNEQKRKRRRNAPTSLPDNIAFMGLTQASVQLRSEFRNLWLNQVRVPLCALDSFLTLFMTTIPKRKTGFDKNGSLRIWLRRTELNDRNIIRLLKHRVRFPDFDIRFEYPPDLPTARVDGLRALLDNSHPRWIGWVKRNIISSVRLRLASIVIVVKERHAPAWMKKTSGMVIPLAYLPTLGLENASPWRITFGVDYS
ncbi:hypothetical protein CC80DRAFT_404029, partial [Byssothecium circinans]